MGCGGCGRSRRSYTPAAVPVRVAPIPAPRPPAATLKQAAAPSQAPSPGGNCPTCGAPMAKVVKFNPSIGRVVSAWACPAGCKP